MAKIMHAGFHVHNPPLPIMYTIFLSLFGIAMRLALHIATNLHCALTMAIAYIFVAETHWISACLLTLFAPAFGEQLLQGLEAALKHAILALVKKPKRNMFAHPNTRYGPYWKRIRYHTRRMRRQVSQNPLQYTHKCATHETSAWRLRVDTTVYNKQTQSDYSCDKDAQHTSPACTRASHVKSKSNSIHYSSAPRNTQKEIS